MATFVEALLGMNRGEIWTRRKYVTNVTELNFFLGFDPRLPSELRTGTEGQSRRVILAAKSGEPDVVLIYVPTWDDYDAEDWTRRSPLTPH